MIYLFACHGQRLVLLLGFDGCSWPGWHSDAALLVAGELALVHEGRSLRLIHVERITTIAVHFDFDIVGYLLPVRRLD